MFDVAFSEILVIAVVALIVIGPEKLPKVARTLGLLAGRMQRYVGTVKADIEREIRLEELRKMEQETHQIGGNIRAEMAQEIQQLNASITPSVEAKPASPHDKPVA